MKKGFITESYKENGEKRKHVKLFEYNGEKFIATWDGHLIPHACALRMVERIFDEICDTD